MTGDVNTDLDARAQELERWTRDMFARWYGADLATVEAAADELAGDVFSCRNPMWSAEGVEAMRESFRRIHAAFSDQTFVIDDLFVKPALVGPDTTTAWWTFTATFDGPLVLEDDRGVIEPSGEVVTIRGVSMSYVQDWKLVGAKACSDLYSVLGTLPPPVRHG